MVSINLKGETLELLPEKAVYWSKTKTLFIADLHLGKASHFRKKGIPVPQGVQESNLNLLQHLIDNYSPIRIFFLGDLFHSRYNKAWEDFTQLIQQYPLVSFELILGNHDILPEENYYTAQLKVHQEGFALPPFTLTHHPLDNPPTSAYNLFGHIHPCVKLQGLGTRSGGVRLPCFHFGKYQGVLPAFGAFTGMAEVKVEPEDRVFVIVEDKVMEV